jgi:hypothetical protein
MERTIPQVLLGSSGAPRAADLLRPSGLCAPAPSHTLLAQLCWGLPAATALTLCRRHQVARPLGDWLGGRAGAQLRALSQARRPLGQTALSALLGALSHVFVDGFTHPGGWATERLALREVLVDGLTVSHALQYVGHVAGSAAGLARIGRLEGVALQAQVPSPTFRRLALLGCALAAPAALTALYTGGGLPVALMRATWAVLAGLMAGALWARPRYSQP